MNLYKARYSVASKNILTYGYLAMYMLLPLLFKFIRYDERVITYFDNVG